MAAANPWLSACTDRPAAWLRLICFANAGATGRSTFRAWADVVPDWIELCAIELPGRYTRRDEAAHTRIEPLMAALVDGVRP
ncbi:MAG TPA: thioesterase domain-containing protein, partial [Kofleriaceae bacterium]|nr:thioesterase domain-containing protein [Kofleriaceae bacterium]